MNTKKNGKINILYLVDTYKNGGGTETHIAHLVKHLDRDRFNCVICSFDMEENSFVDRIRNSGTPVEYIRVGRIYGFHAIYQALKLLRLIKNYKIDIVQSFHFKSDTYGIMVSKFGGVANIISSRRDMGDLKKSHHVLLNKLANHLVDRFIMVCDSVGVAAQKKESIPDKKMTTIYNGVDPDNFPVIKIEHLISIKNDLGIQKNAFVIGSVAYFRHEKAYDVFFGAIDRIREKIKDWTVLILGDGPLEKEFKTQCKRKGLDRHVKFVGSILDVTQYIALMDVVCLVPRSNEGFSNAILEAMAMRKAVIATDIGGNAEAVINGETGIIIPPNDPVRLAEAIMKLHQDAGLRIAMGMKGRERVQKYFSLGQMVKKTEDIYFQLCEVEPR